jgi:general secretion pathway protein G
MGFTLMELMLVVAILGILGSVAVPAYLGYLEKARVARSIAEIRHIEKSIKLFYVTADNYPLTLAELGVDNVRDPWGMPYQYLNVMALAAVATSPHHSAELEDRNALWWSWFSAPSAHATPPPDRGNGNGGTAGNRGQGSKQGGGNQGGGSQGGGSAGQGSPGASGNGAASSMPAAGVGTRKDRFGAPLNSDFDLYSMGRNRETADSLSTPQSYDDIVRASDGIFVGLASDF